jgi:hypothetical protein
VRLVVTNNLTICDVPVFWYIFEFYKEAFVCAWNVANALKKAACLVAEASISQGLKVWVIHKGHVLNLLTGYRMYHFIGKLLLGPMIGVQGNGNVGCFHVSEIVL